MKEIFKNQMQNNRVVIDGNQTVTIYKQADDFEVLNFYFEKDNKRFFFKANSRYSLDVSELLSYALDKEVFSDATAFLPATFTKDGKVYHGVISEDITKNNADDELVNGSTFLHIFENKTPQTETGKRKERFNTIEHYKLALGIFMAKNFNIEYSLEKDFFLNLAKHMISGFMRADEDMHAHNIPIVVKANGKNKKQITLGKLFDNSMSFLLKSHRSNLRDGFEDLDLQQKKRKIEVTLEDVGFPFQVKASNNKQTGRQQIAREIASLICKYPELEKHYMAYKGVNVKKLFDEFKNDNNYDFIKDSDIELASMVVKNSSSLLEQAIAYEKMQNRGPMRFLKQSKDDISLEF